MDLRFTLWILGALASLVLAFPQVQDNSSGNVTTQTPQGTSTASSSGTSSTTSSSSDSNFTGDAVCVTAMCIGALVNGSTVQYTLQSRDIAPLGWMAMGFGTAMSNSAMVIMWANSDGSITLSQRSAPGEVMPTVNSTPPFAASVDLSMSSVNGANPKFTYTRPLNSTSTENIIWAYGSTNPGSSSVSANLVQHIAYGTSVLNIGNTLNSSSRNPTNPLSIGFSPTDPNSNTTSTDAGSGSSDSGAAGIPLDRYEKMLVAHGILTAVGFLVLLPFGALIARYLRVFTPLWFTGHWIFQFTLALPVIVAGVALGITGCQSSPLDDEHKKWGVAIFVLYFSQLLLGALVHWVKSKSAKTGIRRPLHNYVHAIFGLFIIAVSFYQVRTGFRHEWPASTGRNVSNAANIIWYIWVVLMPVLYFAGLLILRRQFRQEEDTQGKNLTSLSDEDSLAASANKRARD